MLGRTLVVNGKSLEIVGVAPRGFHGTAVGARVQVFVPISVRWHSAAGQLPNFDSRRDYWLYMFGRLKAGVSLDQAQAAINVPYRAVNGEAEAPTITQQAGAELERFRAKSLRPRGARAERKPGAARTPLTVFLGATARPADRLREPHEPDVGARRRSRERNGRARVARRRADASDRAVRVEALLLAASAAVQPADRVWTLQGIKGLIREWRGVPARPGPDAHPLAPIRDRVARGGRLRAPAHAEARRTDPARALQASGARSFGGKGISRFRFILSTAQIGLSMLLLVFAGLLPRKPCERGANRHRPAHRIAADVQDGAGA